MNDVRIAFFGTSSFAVPSLKNLVNQGGNVVATITASDKPQGGQKKNIFSPIKKYAIDNTLCLLQPTNLKCPKFLQTLKDFEVDIQIVVAFRMLPKVVWNMPPLGTFNLHASLLPHYRGSAPIPWAIINGEKTTGVTTFFIDNKIDTGNIIFQDQEPILDTDNAHTLHDRLMEKGAKLVVRTAKAIIAGKYPSIPQQKCVPTKTAPKIFRPMCEIKWNQRTTEVYNFVRGLSPSPGAWARIGSSLFKIFKIEIIKKPLDKKNTQQFITDNTSYLYSRATDGYISIKNVQLEGKKRMTIEAFLRGHKIHI